MNDPLEELKRELAAAAGWHLDNMLVGLCVRCGRNALEHSHDDAAKAETKLSGLCGECWDIVMGKDQS